ncbi:MAG: pyruvate, phosphate dikinase [Polyangiaceae bacterium]
MAESVFFFGAGRAEGDPKRREILGGKGAGLAEMTVLGLPVPPGFTIGTDVCVAFSRTRRIPDGVRAQVEAALGRLEESQGRTLGGTKKPLLVSVRSGAQSSMPGMMDTILNLGMNDSVVEALAGLTRDPRFAFDAYRRFIAMHATVALGAPKEPFDRALDDARRRVASRLGPRGRHELGGRALPDALIPTDELKELVATFKRIVQDAVGRPFPSDPHQQLWQAIEAVFDSWNNRRAQVYRQLHSIPDDWGTACNIQAMVYGNLGDASGTGVAFTRNPSTGAKAIYGEWLPHAQGEDVVAGVRTPWPIARGERDGDESLEARMPNVYRELERVAARLEQHFRDMQDLEFTVECGILYMLQCRSAKRTARAAVRAAVDMANEGLITTDQAVLRVDPDSIEQLLHPTLDPKAAKIVLARGLPASPGATSGRIVFEADEAEKLSKQGVAVILVRTETSPEDIHGMQAARGTVTTRGGMTSHAAVVARGMGKPCVAGVNAMKIDAGGESLTVTAHDDDGRPTGHRTLRKGEVITVDGGSGEIYAGEIATVSAALSGEFGVLMGWADQVRRMNVRTNADTPTDARTARAFGAEGIGLCRTEHMFFDEARIGAIREMILAEEERGRAAALEKLLPFQRDDFIAIFREMRGLPVTIRLLDPPLHEFLPTEPAQIDRLAQAMGVPAERIVNRARELHEVNPMLGHRGCRLAVSYPEIYAMQARAIFEAAVAADAEGVEVRPEVMIPLAMTRAELEKTRDIVVRTAGQVFASTGRRVEFSFGTMIELPRAAVMAAELAQVAEFFSFGTNDLTQATMGLSRDDAGKFLPAYVESGILPKDPFVSLDQAGVGALVRMGIERGRAGRATLKAGVCGEHGGDPTSIGFFHELGLAYVSCSPYRVPIARLAAAQAALRGKSARDT